MFGKAQFAKSRKKKPFTSLILTWLSIMYEVCFLDTPSVLIGLSNMSSSHVLEPGRARAQRKNNLLKSRPFRASKEDNVEVLQYYFFRTLINNRDGMAVTLHDVRDTDILTERLVS